jgi:hypothetical protein
MDALPEIRFWGVAKFFGAIQTAHCASIFMA